MGLEGVLGVIERDCAGRLGEIEASRAAEVEALLAGVRERAEQVRLAAVEAVVRPAERERLAGLHTARLDARRTVSAARTEVLECVLDRVREALAEVRRTPAYPALLAHLITQALADLGASLEPDETPHVSADPRDRGIVEPILRSFDPPPAAGFDLDCMGGVIVRSPDGRIVVDNTVEARLERSWPALRPDLVRILEGD